MLSSIMLLLISVILLIFTPGICVTEVLPSSLYLYSPGSLDFTDVIVKRVGDNLTLICELRGDTPPTAFFVWNYMATNETLAAESESYSVWSNSTVSQLTRARLTEADSGRYFCAAPPHSQAKYILVQPQGGRWCATSAFRCGSRCVLAANVCDGRADCTRGEDEAETLCGPRPCDRPDRLNCSMGRCIPVGACCLTPHPLCRQHSCCTAHNNRGFDLELIPPFEDRRAPDDYGFIQSTIYTVTACALIFMIAVVLLVSAICKMHMKRAALRSYNDTRYNINLGVQRHRFPPCYDAGDLLDHPAHDNSPLSPLAPLVPLAPLNPSRDDRCVEVTSASASPTHGSCRTHTHTLAALANVFTSRYRQVPTQCGEVEMVAPPSPSTPTTNPPPAADRHRLTLQLGRFHLSIPSFRRDPRPDTPNVAEINIDDLDFVRLNANDTYTLNGRTIRLLNGNFENIPVLNNPPPYNEAMRYKLYGPPPQYLSSDRLNRNNSEERARNNVEMPPGYEELGVNAPGLSDGAGTSFYCANVSSGNCSGLFTEVSDGPNVTNVGNDRNTGIAANTSGLDSVQDNGNVGMAQDEDNIIVDVSNTDDLVDVGNNRIVGNAANTVASVGNNRNDECDSTEKVNGINNVGEELANIAKLASNRSNNISNMNTGDDAVTDNNNSMSDVAEDNGNNNETLNSVIDNLPAIDSDVNANDGLVGV